MIYKFYSYLISFGILAGVVGAGYLYYKDSQKKIAQLTESNAELKFTAELCERTVESLSMDILRTQRLVTDLEEKNKEAEEYSSELLRKLQEHDLVALTFSKPGLIEKRVNNATKKVFRDIESITALD